MEKTIEKDYSDIINLSRPSWKRVCMSLSDRAAQFAPFAALSGYEEAVKESERETCEKNILSEDCVSEINRRLGMLSQKGDNCYNIKVTYFEYDETANGGKYVDVAGKVESVDEYKRLIVFVGGFSVSIDNVYKIEGDIFSEC